MEMASDVSALFPSQEDWDASPRNTHLMRRPGTNYLGLSIPDLPNSHAQYAFGIDAHEQMKDMQATFDVFTHAGDMGQVSAPLHFVPPAMYISQASFIPTNARTAGSPGTNTISPLQMRFDSSFHSNSSVSTDSNMHSAASSSFDPWSEDVDQDRLSRNRHSATTDVDSASPTIPVRKMRQRRKSEHVKPGSTRAIYLENNRKAASKCRNKQKLQQEELVETARNFKRKNQALKAEVEFLKCDMSDLMKMVGKHTDCADNRLRTYVQREADRLVVGDKNNEVAQLLSPKANASPEKE